jgi:hypothetical protein
MGYQKRDAHIIDYDLYELSGVRPYPGGGLFRGPRVANKDYIACIGAAQTFGCFCAEPFPVLLSKRLDIETLNLGYGGASPTFHLSNPGLMHHINHARLVIVQVLSGRSQSNSLFQIKDHGMEGVRVSDGLLMSAEEFFTALLNEEPEKAPTVVAETRDNYVKDMCRLLDAIAPPKILFWFSVRSPDYHETYALPLWKLWGNFPQFVNRPMIDELRAHCDAYIECISRDGLPQPLYDRQGNPTSITYCYSKLTQDQITETHNRYYPSPEMHRSAAALLEPVCRTFLMQLSTRPASNS